MLRIMTFNIRYASAPDGALNWDARRARAAQRIRAFDPDLLGLQECRLGSQASYIRAQLPAFTFAGEPRGGDGDTAREMAPILFKSKRFRKLGQGVRWLSLKPDQPGSVWPGANFPRTFTWVHLQEQDEQGKELFFCNVHLDYATSDVTAAQARLATDLLDTVCAGHPHILVGDFNADKRSPAYAILLDTGLQDAYRQVVAGGGIEEGTFHDYGRTVPPEAIDWVMISAHFRASQVFVDRSVTNRLYPSDHYPLAAVIEWADQGSNLSVSD